MMNIIYINYVENKIKYIPKNVYNINVKGNFNIDEISRLIYLELNKAKGNFYE